MTMKKLAGIWGVGWLALLSGCAGSISASTSPCPADFDGDGYVGAADLCPHQAEDGKGPEPRDGCPLKVEGGVAMSAPPAPTMQMIQPRLPVLSRGRLEAPAAPHAPIAPHAPAAQTSVHANVSAAPGSWVLPSLPILPRAKLMAEASAPPVLAIPVVPDPPKVDPPKVDPPKVEPPIIVPPKRVEVVGDEIKINEKILFETGSANIDKKSDELIQTIAKIIVDTPDVQFIEIAGHADQRGSEQLNKDLTQRRAQTVLKHLVADGVAATKLRAVGYGSYCPLDPGMTEEAYDKNRRVEFRILRRGGVDASVKWGGCEAAQKKGMAPQPIPATAAKGSDVKPAAPATPAAPAKPIAPVAPVAPTKPVTPPATPAPTPPVAPKKNP